MVNIRSLIYAGVLSFASLTLQAEAAPPAAEPTWARSIIPTGQERAIVKSTPVELRPYRPLHIYGNTVRRRHYHGTAIPIPRDLGPRK